MRMVYTKFVILFKPTNVAPFASLSDAIQPNQNDVVGNPILN